MFAFFAPSSYRIERSKKIGASPEIIYEQLAFFENWENWSPWKEKDPSLKYSYQGETGFTDAVCIWDGDEKLSGSGSRVITDVNENSQVRYSQTYDEREMDSDGGFSIIEGEFTTEVRWFVEWDVPFLFRPIAALNDLESQMIPDLERGLERLDSVAELKQEEY